MDTLSLFHAQMQRLTAAGASEQSLADLARTFLTAERETKLDQPSNVIPLRRLGSGTITAV